VDEVDVAAVRAAVMPSAPIHVGSLGAFEVGDQNLVRERGNPR
jgi:hypothetical protein